MSDVLAIDSLSIDYRTAGRPVAALSDVAMSIGQGEIVGVVGESGCGKSTLAAAIMRLLAPNAVVKGGTVKLNDDNVLDLDERQLRTLRGSDVSMIFQDPMTSLNPTFTVGQQMNDIIRQHRGRGMSGHDLRETGVKALQEVELPDAESRIDDFPHQFSGGQRQRILIAMSLLLEPDLLVADEPTSALDVTLEAQILRLLLRLRDEHGTSMLYVSHDIKTVRQLCDRVVVLYAGRVVEEGPTRDVLTDPLHPYTRALLGAVPRLRGGEGRLASIEGRVPDLRNLPAGCAFADRCQEREPWMPDEMPPLVAVGNRHVRCHLYSDHAVHIDAPRSRSGTVDPVAGSGRSSLTDAIDHHVDRDQHDNIPLVSTSDLAVHFQRRGGFGSARSAPVRAVDGVSLEIRHGEILGLAGESGSGKSTLGETVVGLQRPNAGVVTFDGRDLAGMRAHELRALRRRVQVIFQDPYSSLSPRLNVEQILLEPYRIHKGIPEDERYTAGELLEMVGMTSEHLGKYPIQLSGGQARRIGIARAISFHPDFIVADEPTSGLDASAAAAVLNLMKDLRDRLNLTYLIITHNLSTLGYMADRIAIMYLGKIVEIGPAERVLERPIHPYTRTLVTASDADASLEGTPATGEIPSAARPPSGCRYHPRCDYATGLCSERIPELDTLFPAHLAACHYSRDLPEVEAASGA